MRPTVKKQQYTPIQTSLFDLKRAKVVRKKWEEALLSNNYKQGRHHLHSGDCWCPLGVLCDVVHKMFPSILRITTEKDGRSMYNGCTVTAPPAVVELVGLFDAAGRFSPNEKTPPFLTHVSVAPDECSVANVNDGGAPFSFIVEVIRNPRSRLFVE